MEVRLMRREDIPGVVEVQAQHRLHVIPDIYLSAERPAITGEWRAQAEERLTGLLDNPARFILAALAEGLVVGYALCEITGATVPDGLATDLEVGYIDTVHVLESRRRQGIARQLAEGAERVFRERGLAYSELAYWQANGSAAVTWPALGYLPLHETVRRGLCPAAPAGSAMTGSVRRATADDKPKLLKLCLERVQYLKNLDDPYLRSALTRANDADDLGKALDDVGADRLGQMLVAESDGQLTGFAAGKVDSPVGDTTAEVKLAGEFTALYARPGEAREAALEALESGMCGFFAANGASHAHAVGVRTADVPYRRFWQARGYEPFHYQARKVLGD